MWPGILCGIDPQRKAASRQVQARTTFPDSVPESLPHSGARSLDAPEGRAEKPFRTLSGTKGRGGRFCTLAIPDGHVRERVEQK